ncbi:MAG TPA: hypothetical protein VK167_09985 [Flavipsychrobacter sp.]|nr:hypothetical protein [Flavipsychrobacter sp.]
MATPKNGFEGIIVYTIHKDGCLNGLYYATGNPAGPTYNEIARKIDGRPEELDGDYVCCWIDGDNNVVEGKLNISKITSNGTFDVKCDVKGKPDFIGTGFWLDDKMFAVHYTTV